MLYYVHVCVCECVSDVAPFCFPSSPCVTHLRPDHKFVFQISCACNFVVLFFVVVGCVILCVFSLPLLVIYFWFCLRSDNESVTEIVVFCQQAEEEAELLDQVEPGLSTPELTSAASSSDEPGNLFVLGFFSISPSSPQLFFFFIFK